MTSTPNLLTISEAAKYLGISEDTLRRWERLGKLIPERTLGNSRRYNIEVLDSIKNYNYKKTSNQSLIEIKNEINEIKEILHKDKKNIKKIDSSTLSNQLLNNGNTLLNSKIKNSQIVSEGNNSKMSKGNIFKQTISYICKIYKNNILFILIFIITFFILISVLRAVLNKITNIDNKLNNKEIYFQDSDKQILNNEEVLQGTSLAISKDKLLVDNNGNIQLTGAISGGYIDTAANNLIVNSSFEQNNSGKALYYLYEEDANENNVFISQDTSLDGSNSLKLTPNKDMVLKITPTYPELSSGRTYTLSFFIKSLGILDTNILLSYGDTKKNYQISGDSDWQLITLTKNFDEKDTPTIDSFNIIVNANVSGGVLYIDNLQLEIGSVITAYKTSTLETDGFIKVTGDTIFPIIADTGSLGTINKPFKEFVVNSQTINNNLNVYGDTNIDGSLTVNGLMEFESVSIESKLNIKTDGLYTGSGIGTKRLDSFGNLVNISSIGLNYGTLTSTTDYLISSTGFGVGGNSNYYFNKNGYIKAEQVNSIQDIKIGDSNGETSSLGIYFTGVSGNTNEAGIRFNVSSGKLEYRDDNSTSWTSLDDLSDNSSSTEYTASNGISIESNDIQLGGSLNSDTTILLGSNNLIYNLNSTGDIEIQESGSPLLFISDDGKIGIGTNSPTAKLDITSYTNFGSSITVASTVNAAAIKITSGAGINKWLTSDALGNASWSDPPTINNYLAGNGIIMNGSTFDLGGELDFSTSLNTGSYDFSFSLDGTGDINFVLSDTGDINIKSGNTNFATFANNGSFTLDSLIFNNTQLSAAGDLGFGLYDNAGNGIFIEDGGDIGFGINNPIANLHIYQDSSNDTTLLIQNPNTGIGAYSDIYLSANDNQLHLQSFGTNYTSSPDISGYSRLWSSSNGLILQSIGGSGGIQFWTQLGNTRENNEQMRITSGGNIGIGTTTPTSKLEVNGVASFTLGTVSLPGIIFGIDTNTGLWSSGSDTINFSTNGSEKVRINSSGYVGIGTTNPESNLDISSGDGRIGFDALDNGTTWGNVITSQIASTNVGVGIGIGGDSAFNPIPRFVVNSDDVFLGFALRPGDGGIPAGSNGNGNLYINGNLGIGTTIPTAGSKLEVNGGHIRVTGGSFIDDGTTLSVPDYVFDSNYQILSLNDLESFINNYQHLPNIPDMYDTTGWSNLSLQDRDMKLLEKTEENVLYILELNSQVQKLKQANNLIENKFINISLSNSGDLSIQNQTYNDFLENASRNSLLNLTATVTNNLGGFITTIVSFGKVISGSIITGLADITNLIADTAVLRQVKVEEKLISPVVEADQMLTDQLAANKITSQELEVKNVQNEVVASIDNTGKASFKDLLVSGDATISGSLAVTDASVSGELYAESARIKTLTAEKIKAESIEGLDAKLKALVTATPSAINYKMLASNEYVKTTPSLPTNWKQELEQLMQRLDNVEEATAAGSWSTGNQLTLDSQILTGAVDTDFAMVKTFLGVLGSASIVNLEVSNSLTVQDSLSLGSDSIATLSDTLYVQPSGIGKVDILAGAVVVESNGTLRVNGDLYLQGSLYAQSINSGSLNTQTATVSGSLFANLIDTKGANLAVNLGEVKGASDSAKFQVLANNEEVASIDASGSARLNKLIIAGAREASSSGVTGNPLDPTVASNATAGTATLTAGEKSLTIQNSNITPGSLVYITPASDTGNTVLYISGKIPAVNGQTGSFTVSVNKKIQSDIQFNWWIIN